MLYILIIILQRFRNLNEPLVRANEESLANWRVDLAALLDPANEQRAANSQIDSGKKYENIELRYVNSQVHQK